MFEKMGLIGGHAYGLIAVKQLRDENGNDLQLLCIRNPWGRDEWNGDWSDKSPLWTDELKMECNYKDADDGMFWMNFTDF